MDMTKRKIVGVGLAAALIGSLSLSACSSGSSGSGGSGSGASSGSTKYTLWDPYPQLDASSTWAKLLDKCAAAQQVTITRQGLDTSALTSKLLLAAQAKNAPDLAVIDNPLVSSVAETGLLETTDELGLSTSGILPNILAAGQSGGKTYGIPLGSNTLALYYNKKLLTAAGVKPPTNWAQLKDAVAKVKAAGHKGIAFSAVGTEEGTFQFLPFFWGAGANLDKLDSPQAVQALTLWTDFVKSGDASASVLNYTQADANDQFLAGNLGFQVNGSWQLPLLDAGKVDYGIIPIPGIDGGKAPAPLGGEFLTVPVQNKARSAVSAKLVSCITTPDNALEWAKGLSYVLPVADPAVQQKEIAQTPNLASFIDAVSAARGRTSELGTKYPKVSEQLWTAIQGALSGSKSPQKALTDAQANVATGS
jgi:multiple sugar transport system substrate-binding protein